MRAFFILLLSFVVSGCQILDAPPLAPRLPAPGSLLILHQDLDVPEGTSRVHIQDGRVQTEDEIDEYRPYCQFQTFDLSTSNNPLRIRADRFRIERAWLIQHSVDVGAMQFAGTRITEFDHGPSQVTLATEMELASPLQPGVYRLSCRYWSDPYERYLTLTQIRTTLGSIASLD